MCYVYTTPSYVLPIHMLAVTQISSPWCDVLFLCCFGARILLRVAENWIEPSTCCARGLCRICYYYFFCVFVHSGWAASSVVLSCILYTIHSTCIYTQLQIIHLMLCRVARCPCVVFVLCTEVDKCLRKI